MRVVLALGVRDGARTEFWRCMGRAASSHRRNFAHAVTLAAMGNHFRKLTEAFCEQAQSQLPPWLACACF